MTEPKLKLVTDESGPITKYTLGQKVAWITRVRGAANAVSAVHCHFENDQTFCGLAIPPEMQHLPLLKSLHVCKRCATMSRSAMATKCHQCEDQWLCGEHRGQICPACVSELSPDVYRPDE